MTATLGGARWLVALGGLVSLAFAGWLLVPYLPFPAPPNVAATGSEEETLYAIWKQVHGLPVYGDRFAIPFGAAYFNWLTYAWYGAFARALLGASGAGEAWLPSAVRLLTLLGGVVGVAASWRLFQTLAGGAARALRGPCLAAAFLVFFGPSVGTFSMCARPALWALSWEALALLAFIRLRRRPDAAALSLAGLGYLAWAFRQTSLSTLAGACLYLLWRRELRPLALAVCASLLLWGATLALGGADYLATAFGAQAQFPFRWSAGVAVLARNALYTLPLWGTSAAALALLAWRGRLRAFATTGWTPLLLCLCAVSLGMAFLTSFKSGSGTNYYFVANLHLGALSSHALAFLLREGRPRGAGVPLALSWAAHGLLIVGLLARVPALPGFARFGPGPVRAQDAAISRVIAKVQSLPRPVFFFHPQTDYPALPWNNPGETHFVLADGYFLERARGFPFQEDGVGGLVRAGRFASLLLAIPRGQRVFDGARLDAYREVPGLPRLGLRAFVRR